MRYQLPICLVVALLASGVMVGRAVAAQGSAANVLTADERLYHGDYAKAPKIVCNTHLSASAAKDTVGTSCKVLQFVCSKGISSACGRVAAYKPDFHNLERQARETSLLSYGAAVASGPSPTGHAPSTSGRIKTPSEQDLNGALKPKVVGGAPFP